MDMYRSALTEDGSTHSREAGSLGAGVGAEAIKGVDGAVKLHTTRLPHVVYDEVVAEANTSNGLGDSPEPPPPGEMSWKFAADVLPECQLLGKVTQR